MAKTQTAVTASPLSVTTGAAVLAQHGRFVAELQNYIAGRRPRVHMSVGAWTASGGVVPAVNMTFPAMGSVLTLTTRIFIDPDVASLTCSLEGNVDAGSTTLRATVAIGTSGTVDLDVTDAENGSEITGTINVADTGTGWRQVDVTLTRVSGAATGDVRYLSVQDTPITTAADLADPVND